MSIGIEITFNKQPIRYYMEMVERQLKMAKETTVPSVLRRFLLSKISMCSQTFLDIDYSGIKAAKKKLICTEKKKNSPKCNCPKCNEKRELNAELKSAPIWDFLMNDVTRLNNIRSERKYNKLLGTPGFFYTLLERLTDETVKNNDLKYINSLLYSLLPQYINSSDKELKKLELLLNASIVRQLLQKGENGMEITLNHETRHCVETYLRLMLLFSDNRYHLSNSDSKVEFVFGTEELENSRKNLLVKSTDILYCLLKKHSNSLFKVFVGNGRYSKTAGTRTIHCQCMQRLKIEKSMFVKLRDTQKISVSKAASMIEIRNATGEDAKKKIDKLNEERKQNEKAPSYLYFDKAAFCKQAGKKGAWSSDFVDALMLLYEYKELAIHVKKSDLL